MPGISPGDGTGPGCFMHKKGVVNSDYSKHIHLDSTLQKRYSVALLTQLMLAEAWSQASAQETAQAWAASRTRRGSFTLSLLARLSTADCSIERVQSGLVPGISPGDGTGPGCFTHEKGVIISRWQLFWWEAIMTFTLVILRVACV